MRAPDQPDRLQPRAAELLPGLPTLRRQTPGGFPPFGSGSLPRRLPGPAYPALSTPRLLRVVTGAGQVARDAPQQTLGRNRDLVDCLFEGTLVAARRLCEPAHLAHELARGFANLGVSGDDVGVAQGFDASAHGSQR